MAWHRHQFSFDRKFNKLRNRHAALCCRSELEPAKDIDCFLRNFTSRRHLDSNIGDLAGLSKDGFNLRYSLTVAILFSLKLSHYRVKVSNPGLLIHFPLLDRFARRFLVLTSVKPALL